MSRQNLNNENFLRNVDLNTNDETSGNSRNSNISNISNISNSQSLNTFQPVLLTNLYLDKLKTSENLLHGKNILKQEKIDISRRQINPIDTKQDNNFDPVKETPKWLNGNQCLKSKVKRQIKIGKTENLKNEVDQIVIKSLNIPHYVVKSDRNPFFECTQIDNNTDIWCFSELYANKNDFPKIPNNYDIFYNENNEIIFDCILVKKSESLEILEKTIDFGMTILKVKTGNRKNEIFFVASGYRSPSKIANNKFYSQLMVRNDKEFREKWCSTVNKFEKEKFVFMGDMNWASNKKYWKNRKEERGFSEWLELSKFTNIFHKSITFNPCDGRNYKPTSIDVAIKSEKFEFRSSETDEMTFNVISDHHCCSIIIGKNTRNTKVKTEYVRKRVDPTDENLRNRVQFYEKIAFRKFKLNDAIKNFNYYDNKNNVCERILDSIEWIKNQSVELVKIVKTDKKFVNKLSKEYYRLMKEKRKRYSFLVQNRRDVKSDRRLKELKRLIQREYRRSVRFGWKKKSEEKLAKNELEWKYIKRFNNETVDIPKSLPANAFAQRFQELSHDYNPIPKNPKTQINRKTSFRFNYKIDIKGKDLSTNINLLIKTCKNSKNSSGWDGVNLSFLRILSDEFHKLIAYLIGCCLKSGCYIERFREVKAMPVFKKGDPKNIKNWRPIQIATWSCNLIEKIMCIQMTQFWEKKGLLKKNQYGFRSNRSVGQLINEMRKEFLKRGQKYGMILLTDLSNAFGSCDSWLIIEKMRPYLSDKALKLLRSFLIQAEVKVKVGGEISDTFTSADRGYSQGSNLSTFLFIVLMSESHSLGSDNIGYSFADDMSILITSDKIEDLNKKGNEALNKFHDFCKSTNIKLNCGKTFYTLLGSKYRNGDKKRIELKTDGEIIKRTDNMNVLGVELNKNIFFEDHFKCVSRSIKNKIRNIIPFSHFSTLDFCSNLVKGFCHGKFLHALCYIPILPSQDYNQINQPIFHFLRRKCASHRELQAESFHKLSQAVVYERSKVPSLLNIHRLAGLQRLNKIFMNMSPLWELEDCLKILTKKTLENWENNRNGIEFMRFNQLSKIQQSTAPGIWVTEFNKLPKNLRNLLGTINFEILCKKYFKSRCQHQENTLTQCKNCKQSTKNYSKNITDHFPISVRPRKNKNIDGLIDIIKSKSNIRDKIQRVEESIKIVSAKIKSDYENEFRSNH